MTEPAPVDLAMAVLVRDCRVLIQHRYRRSCGMIYEFPGGSVEPGESPEQAAKRELTEETSLRIISPPLAVFTHNNELGGAIHFVVLSAPCDSAPLAVDPVRIQSFYWFYLADICLPDFHQSDVEFITTQLVEFIH